MKRILVAFLVALGLAMPLRAQDNWFGPGLLTGSAGTPIAAGQVFGDGPAVDPAFTDVKQTAQIIVASSVTAGIALQRIGADGTTIIHEQAFLVNAGTTFTLTMSVEVFAGEHLRLVNKIPLTSGSLWPSLIIN